MRDGAGREAQGNRAFCTCAGLPLHPESPGRQLRPVASFWTAGRNQSCNSVEDSNQHLKKGWKETQGIDQSRKDRGAFHKVRMSILW